MPDTPEAPYPFIAFNFSVEIHREDSPTRVCSAYFSECDGLEMTMEVKTIREGGNNDTQIRLTGPRNYGQLSLKRGMTDNFDLWDWFNTVLTNPKFRANVEVVLRAENKTPRVHFILTRCLPIKLKAPALNAKDGIVAIEELQIAYESLSIERS
jgi:phage tail-like protein